MILLLNIFILIILIVLSGFFAGVETAYVSISKLKVHYLIEKKKKNAKLVKKLKDNYDRLIITLLIGNNLVNIAASSLATAIAIDLFNSNGVAIAIGFMTFIILVFGEITPKTIAMTHNQKITLFTAPLINMLMIVFYPLVLFFEQMTRVISNIFAGSVRKRPTITEEEIKSVINLGKEVGEVEDDEKEMIHNIFRFSDMTAHEIMVPLDKVFFVKEEEKLLKFLPRANRKGFSRIPVYSKKHDSFIGIIYIKDILKLMQKGKADIFARDIMQQAIFVPEDIFLDDLLEIFREKKVHFAIVKNRDDNVSGIVTLEDLLEEIVGEIYDETDIEKTHIRRIDEHNFVAEGKSTIYDINRICSLKIKPKEDYDTLEDFLRRKLKRKPRQGDVLSLPNVDLIVETTTDKGIKVKILPDHQECL